jgi:orotidine-5'-phosphate decarboxylase|tara:strand:+ start:9001 stop:9705 length:705 start_codon:yes stop_codon:yes gene_type:complete
MENSLILALDNEDLTEIKKIVNELCPPINIVKIGPISFLNNHKELFDFLSTKKISVMFDFKFFDIPNTMSNSINFLFNNNINIFTVHALAGETALRKLKNELDVFSKKTSEIRPKMFAVTLLTSFNQNEINSLNFKGTISDNVLNLAEKSIKSGVDGLVCSGEEISLIRKNFGNDIKLLVPGIRFNSNANDQSRIVSPRQAIDMGADYLVLGRTLTEANDRKSKLDDIINSLKN